MLPLIVVLHKFLTALLCLCLLMAFSTGLYDFANSTIKNVTQMMFVIVSKTL